MKRLSMILASLFLFVGMALAQTTVKGTVVTYEENEPIIGATVQVVGADNIGTITDVNGQFTLEVPAGKNTLKITYVGMEPLEVAVSSKPLRIQLRSEGKERGDSASSYLFCCISTRRNCNWCSGEQHIRCSWTGS